jgi:hypothetical protein
LLDQIKKEDQMITTLYESLSVKIDLCLAEAVQTPLAIINRRNFKSHLRMRLKDLSTQGLILLRANHTTANT